MVQVKVLVPGKPFLPNLIFENNVKAFLYFSMEIAQWLNTRPIIPRSSVRIMLLLALGEKMAKQVRYFSTFFYTYLFNLEM
jgi:hypothetical protein